MPHYRSIYILGQNRLTCIMVWVVTILTVENNTVHSDNATSSCCHASKLPFIRECMSVAHMTTYKMKKYMANNYKEISKQLMFNN